MSNVAVGLGLMAAFAGVIGFIFAKAARANRHDGSLPYGDEGGDAGHGGDGGDGGGGD